MPQNTRLLLLTDFYPFEVREPFVKNEIPYLTKAFKHVHVFCSHPDNKNPIYSLAPNESASHIVNSLTLCEKILSFRWIFSKLFREEIYFIRKNYQTPVSVRLIKTMLLTLQMADKYEKLLKEYIEANKLNRDLLVIYSYWTDARAIAAARLKKSMKATAISRAHGWDVYFERQTPAYLPFRKYIHDNLDAVFFVSANGRDYSLQRIKGSTPEKFRISRLGTVFHKRNPESRAEKMIIVSNAGFIPLKRIFLIPGILARLKDVPVHWIHFGWGPMKDEIERYSASRLKDYGNISFEFKGRINNSELMEFYGNNHVDLFLHTSEFEGFPVVIMEALSFGIPVMSTIVGGIGKIVNDENGFPLAKDFKPEQAARLIESYHASSEAEKQKRRDAALRTWQEYFNAEKNYPGFIEGIFDLARLYQE